MQDNPNNFKRLYSIHSVIDHVFLLFRSTSSWLNNEESEIFPFHFFLRSFDRARFNEYAILGYARRRTLLASPPRNDRFGKKIHVHLSSLV